MAFDPSNSAIRVDASLEEKLKGATHEQIKELLKDAAVEQRLAVREWDESILTATALAGAAPQKVGKVIVLNGVKHSLVGSDEADVLAQENALYRASMAQPVATETQTEQTQPRNERGQFVSAEDAAAKAYLELQFKRGDIGASEFLEKSGAVADYLAQQGVPIEDLKASVAEKQNDRYQASWASATEEFLHSPEGADWPGGEECKNILGRLIAENPELMNQPSVETLAAVWKHMKENNLAVENKDATYARELSEAQSPSEISEVNHKYFGGSGSGGSGLFDRR